MTVVFRHFNPVDGHVLVSYGDSSFNIRVPIENNTYLSGNQLLEYVHGIVAPTESDSTLVKGGDAVQALCISPIHAIAPTYAELRDRAYPPLTLFIDGMVKADAEQMQQYVDLCLAVKAKFPKPIPVEVSQEVLQARRDL